MTAERQPCHQGGRTHAWESTGLDIDASGVLVNSRRCVWCGTEQHKPYGAGGSKPWRPAKPSAHRDVEQEPEPCAPTA